MKHGRRSVACLFIVISLGSMVHTQPACRYTGPDAPLSKRFEWANGQARAKGWSDNFWIGYSIVKNMSQHSFIGSWSSDPERNRPSLSEVITGMRPAAEEHLTDGSMQGDFDGVCLDADTIGKGPSVQKEVGIVLHYAAGGKLRHVTVSNLTLHVDLAKAPLIWMNGISDSESVQFLEQLYANGDRDEVRKQIISAIGLHESQGTGTEFLINVLRQEDNAVLRKEAAFSLGQGGSGKGLQELVYSAGHDASREVRKEAIFGMSQVNREEAVDDLIKMAKEEKDVEVRKEAVFWLGQKATAKSISTLNEIVENGDDAEVQKNAVFALSQLPGSGGMESMIRLANGHENPVVRKAAIFWLGQSDDPKALDALIQIVKR